MDFLVLHKLHSRIHKAQIMLLRLYEQLSSSPNHTGAHGTMAVAPRAHGAAVKANQISWAWQDDSGYFVMYEPDTSRHIEHAYQWSRTAGLHTTEITVKHTKMLINFHNMTQTNPTTKRYYA